MKSDEFDAAKDSNRHQQFEKLDNSLLSISINCTDVLFDCLSLTELAALNLTCKKLQELTNDYFRRKYPMKCMKAVHTDTNNVIYRSKDESLQPFAKTISNLVVLPSTKCFRFLDTHHSKHVWSIAFYDGEILENDAAIIAAILENVEIIEIQYGKFGGEFYDTMLKYCTQMKQLVIKYGFDECDNSGINDQWLLKLYPNLEHFHWSPANLPEHLDIFFRQNPNIRSFNSGTYTTLNMTEFMLRTGTMIDELHFELILELYGDDSDGMALIRSNLNTLYERQQFKGLMIEFDFCSQLLYPDWATLQYLIGAYIDFPREPGSTKALSTLIHLKMLVLGINTILSPAKANILSKTLNNLEEIYIQINSVHVLTAFLRNSIKLKKVYVYKMGQENGFNTKIKKNMIFTQNIKRMKLNGACKTVIYLPDQAYVQMMCQTDNLNYSLVEIKRSESCAVKHPFAATRIRKDMCELYEKF